MVMRLPAVPCQMENSSPVRPPRFLPMSQFPAPPFASSAERNETEAVPLTEVLVRCRRPNASAPLMERPTSGVVVPMPTRPAEVMVIRVRSLVSMETSCAERVPMSKVVAPAACKPMCPNTVPFEMLKRVAAVPCTASALMGEVVPMPTLPEPSTVSRPVPLLLASNIFEFALVSVVFTRRPL